MTTGSEPSPASGPGVTVDLERREVVVTMDGEDDVVLTIEEHRVDVLRRLLERGLSASTLTTLFPAWTDLIDAVSGRVHDPV